MYITMQSYIIQAHAALTQYLAGGFLSPAISARLSALHLMERYSFSHGGSGDCSKKFSFIYKSLLQLEIKNCLMLQGKYGEESLGITPRVRGWGHQSSTMSYNKQDNHYSPSQSSNPCPLIEHILYNWVATGCTTEALHTTYACSMCRRWGLVTVLLW